MDLFKNRRVQIVLAVSVLVLLIWYLAIYSTFSSQVSSKSNTLNQDQQQLSTLNGSLASIKAQTANSNQTNAELNKLQSLIPSGGPQLGNFTLQLNSLGASTGTFVTAASIPTTGSAAAPQAPSGSGSNSVTVETATASVSILCVLSNCLNFITGLYSPSFPRLVVLDDLQLPPGPGPGTSFLTNSSPITLGLELTIFYTR